jgi:ProP effector
MPDIPKIPETAPAPAPHATPLGAPTEEAPAATAAAAAPAPRTEPSVADTARLLSQHFPALFGEGVIKPIKLRIHADIHQRAPGVFAKKTLSIFLQRHTTGTAYLKALMAEGATRIDLDGQPAGDVAAEHREAAGVELERRRALVEARKQAGREAARASRHDAQSQRPAPRGAPSVQPGTSDRPERAPRPSQPSPGPRRAQPPQARSQRGTGRPGDTESGAPRRPHKPLPEQKRARAPEPKPVTAPAVPLTPEQAAETEARRQRALLLRSFEQSPLSKANFGALKGLSEEALDALLTLARQERGSR